MKISKLYSNVFLMVGLGGLGLSVLFTKYSWLVVWSMFSLESYSLDMLFIFDWISVSFFSVLCLIVGCVLKFSSTYMEGDMNEYRFLLVVLSFVLSMAFLMFVPHFMMLLLGWDGLGLSSFLLIVYYASGSSWGAGLKTYLVNRLGDAFLVVCLVMLFSQGHWYLLAFDKYLVWLIVLLFVFGAFTKSAQYPFSSWLPAAMAAPTPVSALVHSSTLVTAGMYLLMRFKYVLPYYVHMMVGLVGLWTLYAASIAACFEWDAKKVMAYSTLSQLGLMCFSLGLGLSMFAFFHLLTHAVFKALLFMCVGYWMAQNSHLQDLRGLKKLWLQNPLCGFSMLISVLALSGFPFLAGFFSKDIIMESSCYLNKSFFYWCFLGSLPLTSFYGFRLLYWLLQVKSKISLQGSYESEVYVLSLMPLLMSSIFMGWFFGGFLSMDVFPSFWFKLLILGLMFFGFYLITVKDVKGDLEVKWFGSNILYMVPLKSSLWIHSLSNMGSFLYMFFDHGWGVQLSAVVKSYMGGLSSGVNRVLLYFSTPNFFFYVGVGMLLLVIAQMNLV